MSKMVRCLACGESFDVERGTVPVKGVPACPTCDNDNFIDIDEDEVEEEEEIMCTCKFCGEDFESDDEGKDICEDCQEALDDSGEPELHMALAEEFGCGVQDIVYNGNSEWQIEGYDYYVYTEDEADEKVADYVRDTLWAFNASFLACETGLPQELFEALAQNDQCEGNNDALEQTIDRTCGMDEFVESAIREDGRGHFLNSYDGNEIELKVDGEWYYCYRF